MFKRKNDARPFGDISMKITPSRTFPGFVLCACVLFGTVGTLSAISSDAEAQAEGARFLVRDVQVEGNSRVETSTISLQIHTKPGAPYDAARAADDVKNIYRTGFFDQVSVRVPSEGVVVFVVTEKPSVRKVLIKGNEKVKEEKIKDKLNITSRFFLDRRRIQAGIDEVKKYYEGEGYYDTAIEYKVLPVQENQVDLEFSVKEGDERLVREVTFRGNKEVDASDLRAVVKTTRYKWWSSWATGTGVVKKEDIEEDIKSLTHYYLNHGFVDAKVGQPSIERNDRGIVVTFPIQEGDVFHFGSITTAGDLIEKSTEKTLDGVEIKSGETFELDKLRKDVFTVSEKFTDIGYAFANVEPATEINRDRKQVDVTFKVDKGKLITVNRITISGNRKTFDNVIRRTLLISEQERFSSSKIRRSQELLQRLGYFDEVTITPEPAGEDNKVNLAVAVREGNTGSFSVGAGIASGDGFLISSRIAENNLFGTGNSLSLDVNTGARRENYVLSYVNPRINDTRLSGGVDLSRVTRRYNSFDRKETGAGVSLGYPLWFLDEEYQDDFRTTLRYDITQVDITGVDPDAPLLVKNQRGQSVSSSITPQIVRNTIDNPLDPSKGSRQAVSTEIAGLGGDQRFWLAQAGNSWYYPLYKSSFGNFVFAQRTHLGYGESFDGDDFPVFRRFFPGGINSNRGFPARKLGPKDENGKVYGGNKEIIGNFETIFPLIGSIGLNGVAFYDVGNAFDDNENINFSDLRQAIGWGIRWRSPLAPIRIEFGYPLDKQEGESSFVTNFSFGLPQ